MCSFHGASAQFLLTGLEGAHLTTFIPQLALELDFLLQCPSLPELGTMPEGTGRKDVATGIHHCWCESRMRKHGQTHQVFLAHSGCSKVFPEPFVPSFILFCPPPSPRLTGGQILICHHCGVSASVQGGGEWTQRARNWGLQALC